MEAGYIVIGVEDKGYQWTRSVQQVQEFTHGIARVALNLSSLSAIAISRLQ